MIGQVLRFLDRCAAFFLKRSIRAVIGEDLASLSIFFLRSGKVLYINILVPKNQSPDLYRRGMSASAKALTCWKRSFFRKIWRIPVLIIVSGYRVCRAEKFFRITFANRTIMNVNTRDIREICRKADYLESTLIADEQEMAKQLKIDPKYIITPRRVQEHK